MRPDVVIRPELLARLDGAPRHLVVRAPAGYGKTTLVRAWIEQCGRRAAWLSLDGGDDDPVVLYRHLVAAVSTVATVSEASRVAVRRGPWDPTTALAGLAVDLADADPFVLVLDDLHEITGGEVLDFVDRFLDASPPGLAVVMSTRAEPGLHRRRRLLEGSLVEVGVDDLKLDRDESAVVLRAVASGLDPETVAVIVDRCDGWAAGIALVGLALAGADDARVLASGLSLADRPVAEYLRDEVLRGLDPETREFMVFTSVLATLDASLCDAVLGRTDSHAVLESLVRAGNLFVVGLDDDRTSYRYHHLWRELLLAELRATAPGQEAALRARAAAWLGAHDRPDDAVGQLLEAGRTEDAAKLIATLVDEYVLTGRVATLRRWVAAFPAGTVVADPGLALTAAWVAMLSGRDDEFGYWLDRIGEFPPETSLASGIPLVLGAAAVELISGRGGTKSTVRVADVLVDAGPEGNPWWLMARVVGTAGRLHAGLLDDPEASLRVVEREVTGAPALQALARAHLITVLLRGERDADVPALADAALDALESAGLDEFAPYAGVLAAHGLAYARCGDAAVARRSLARTERLARGPSSIAPRARLVVHLLLADAFVALDDLVAGAAHLRAGAVMLEDEPDAQWLHEYADELAERLDAATGADLIEPLSAAELRVLRELPTHRSLREIADSLYVSRNTVKTQTVAIYRKLGVSSRSAAVERARELGLLAL